MTCDQCKQRCAFDRHDENKKVRLWNEINARVTDNRKPSIKRTNERANRIHAIDNKSNSDPTPDSIAEIEFVRHKYDEASENYILKYLIYKLVYDRLNEKLKISKRKNKCKPISRGSNTFPYGIALSSLVDRCL